MIDCSGQLFAPLFGNQQNLLAQRQIRLRPMANFAYRSEAAQTNILLIQAAVTHTRRLERVFTRYLHGFENNLGQN